MPGWNQWIGVDELDNKFLGAEFYAPEFLQLDNAIRKLSHKKLRSLSKSLFQGWSPKGGVKNDDGVPAIKVQNLTGKGININYKHAQIEPAQVPQRAWAEQGDIFVIRCAHHPRYIGLSIDSFYKQKTGIHPFITEKIIVARGVSRNANVGFVTSFLRTNYAYQQIQRRLGGLTANYTPDDFGEIRIPLPAPKIQDYIGAKVALAERCRAEAEKNESIANHEFVEGLGFEPEEFLATIGGDRVFSTGGFTVFVEPSLLRNRLDPVGYHPELLDIQKIFRAKRGVFQKLTTLADIVTDKRPRVGNESDYFISVLHVDNRGFINRHVAKEYSPESNGRQCKDRDILVSGINPAANRIAVCDGMEGQIGCSPEFSILCSKKLPPHYLAFAMRSDVVYRQMIHLGKGTSSSRRRIDEPELFDVEIPVVENAEYIASLAAKRQQLIAIAFRLSAEAKSDVEALIEGTLDTDAILAGRLHAPTWDDIEKELEEIE